MTLFISVSLGPPPALGCQEEDAGSDVQRVTLTAGSILSRPRASPPGHGGHPGGQGHHGGQGSGWRISPIPWRMMLSGEAGGDPGAGPSSSPDYSQPRYNSSPDLNRVTSNKRPLEDHDQGPSNLKIRRSSPEHVAREYDDIDRKISMAGNNHIITIVILIVDPS